MWNEFKKFALKGSMIDLAIGIIIGGAVGKVITSFVNDILMPPIGLLLGRVNFTSLYINLGRTRYPTFDAAQAAGAPTINIGLFLGAVIYFFLISLVIFFMVSDEQVERDDREEDRGHAPDSHDQGVPFLQVGDRDRRYSMPTLHQ